MSETTTQIKCQSCHAALEVMGQAGGVVRCEYCGTQNLLSKEVRTVKASDSHDFMVALYKAIADEFSDADLQDLTIRVNERLTHRHVYRISYDDLSGTTKTIRALSLVQWCRNRSELQALVDTVLAIRPTIDINVHMR